MLRRFQFPSFDEWIQNNRRAHVAIGDYHAAIGCTIRGVGDNTRDTYSAAIAMASNPLNVWTGKMFFQQRIHDRSKDSDEDLRIWYNQTILALNEAFVEYFEKTYYVQ